MKQAPLIALGMVLIAIIVLALIQRYAVAYTCDRPCLDFYDLQAQQAMAVAAWVTAIVGIISVPALLGSVIYSARAAREAIESNRIARSENRAWVGFESVAISDEARVDPTQIHVTVTAVLRNYGARPAHSLSFHAALYPDMQSLEAHRSDMGVLVFRGFEPLFPGNTRTVERLATTTQLAVEEALLPIALLPGGDRAPFPLVLYVQARYATEGDQAHDTAAIYWVTSEVGNARWWRTGGLHRVDSGMRTIGALNSWAT